MSFRSDCPQSYQPAGFRSAETHSIAVADWQSLWQTPSTTVASFEAAHHVVKISARNKEYEEQTASQLRDTIMSKQLHNMQRTSPSGNIGIRSTMPIPATPIRAVAEAKDMYAQKRSKTTLENAPDHDNELQANGAMRSHAEPQPRRRKMSISGRFIEMNRSSPTSGVSFDEDGADNHCDPQQCDHAGRTDSDFN